jgi:hypothetical protein
MTLVDVLLIAIACGYMALTTIGVATTTSVTTFIDEAIGRKLRAVTPPPWYYMFLGLFYVFATMWAVGLVASQEGGKFKLTLSRVKYDIENGGLTPQEVGRLREACNILKETSRF